MEVSGWKPEATFIRGRYEDSKNVENLKNNVAVVRIPWWKLSIGGSGAFIRSAINGRGFSECVLPEIMHGLAWVHVIWFVFK